MTRRLILIRHAKSSWGDTALDDHDRPLKRRGRLSAEAIGGWLKSSGYAPDAVLCSTAARARETVALMNLDAPVDYLPRLYHAGPDTILSVLKEAEADVVAMVGHNPGLASFASAILDTPPPHGRFEDYPTCATLVADFDADRWSAVRFGTGRVKNFITPRELTGDHGPD